MTNEELAELGEPEAVRYGFDGYGYMYLDNGSGSDWLTRIPDAEPLYPVTALQSLIATAREAEALRAENARLRGACDLWSWLALHSNIEIRHSGWDDEVFQWEVYSVNGGRNDQEWTLRGTGDTPFEAMKAARAALEQGEVK